MRRLGHGYFGEVWECTPACCEAEGGAGGPRYAVKKVPLSLIQQHNHTEQMEREIDILRSLKHPHIVQLFFDFRDSDHVYLGMEFAAGGGMFDLLSRSGKFSLELSAQYFYEVCDALEYIHGLPDKVIHRDIKPENILLDAEGHAKLADFGWSNSMDSGSFRATFCGTPDYLAPEMIRGEGHNESLDMWEMGVLLYEMIIGKSPFGANSQGATCLNILKGELKFPSSVDPDAKDLIAKLCRLRPEERLSAKEAKEHAFVTRFLGRPTEAIGGACGAGPGFAGCVNAAGFGAEEPPACRPSVEARHLRRENELLAGELAAVVQAKSVAEETLRRLTAEQDASQREFEEERRLRVATEARFRDLKDQEEQQVRDLQALRLGLQAATAEAGRLRGARGGR